MVIKIGHRGAKGYYPENTLASFKKALELKVDMIELDVRLSKDKNVIVFHDKKVNRLTNKKGYVSEKTLKELKLLNVENEKIPTLEDVLNLVNKKAIVNIELKEKNTAEPVSKIIEFFVNKKKWSYNHFLVCSFDFNELEKVNKKIRIGLLYPFIHFNIIKTAKRLKAYSINLNYRFVNKRLINKIQKENFKVFVWTVNKTKDIQNMKKINVDGIISDFPDLL